MGKASSAKKVARIAGTGGGRTARGRRPYGWYSVLTGLVLLGIFLVYFSRGEQQAAASVHPRGADHWHAAYGIDVCGQFQANLPQPSTLLGLHTHGDGLVHVEPFVTAASADQGTNATLARFVEGEPGLVLTSSSIQYPGGKLYKNGDKCNGKPSQLRIRVWAKPGESASITYTDPKKVRIMDQTAITIAFIPAGDDIPKPLSIPALKNPNAKETPASTPGAPTTPGAPVPITPGSVPAASVPGSPAPAASTPAGSVPAPAPAPAPSSAPPTSAAAGTPTSAP